MKTPILDMQYFQCKIPGTNHDVSLLFMRQVDNVVSSHETGSRYICDPPPTDTDRDVIVLVKDLFAFVDDSQHSGWEVGGSRHEDITEDDFEHFDFVSLVNGELNLIVTQREDWYEAFVAATLEAKRLNLLVKADRIALFKKYREGL